MSLANKIDLFCAIIREVERDPSLRLNKTFFFVPADYYFVDAHLSTDTDELVLTFVNNKFSSFCKVRLNASLLNETNFDSSFKDLLKPHTMLKLLYG